MGILLWEGACWCWCGVNGGGSGAGVKAIVPYAGGQAEYDPCATMYRLFGILREKGIRWGVAMEGMNALVLGKRSAPATVPRVLGETPCR